ncbi:MAG TPA: hypothetical protein PLI13_04215, partial [Paracoccus sp. (in: a-proteobacteria)]|nr:hypothetical protein [Paracoccus sp. (in: a-proteobacteria)]
LAAPENDPVDLPELAGESPIPVPPPGKVEVPGLDRAPGAATMQPDSAPVTPVAAPPAAAEPAPEPAPEPEPEAAIATLPTPEPASQPVAPAREPAPQPTPQPTPQPAAIPGAHLAVPDLSLPPDFDALKLTD